MDCIFCKIVRGEIPSKGVYEDAHVLAFHDLNPVAPTHVLVIPRNHVTSVAEAGEEDSELLGRVLLGGKAVAEKLGLKEGYRLVINNGEQAGQSVFHLHLHVLGGRQLKWPPG